METTERDNIVSTPRMSQDTAGALDRTSSKAHAAVDSIAGAADEGVPRAKPAIDRIVATAHHAVDSAAGAAAPTADWLAERGASLKAAQKNLVADTCNYVSVNPLKSVGIAVAAGIVISRAMLFFRDRKRAATPPSA